MKIDAKTLSKENKMYARLLIDIDFLRYVHEKLLVTWKMNDFLVQVIMENPSVFCSRCGIIGHRITTCGKFLGKEVGRNTLTIGDSSIIIVA